MMRKGFTGRFHERDTSSRCASIETAKEMASNRSSKADRQAERTCCFRIAAPSIHRRRERLAVISRLLREFLQEFAGDDHALYLIGAFDDLADLGFAHQRLHRVIFAGAVTAIN